MMDDANIEQTIPLESPRLLIDRFTPADWVDYYEIERSPEQHRYNREAFRPKTAEQTVSFIKGQSEVNYDSREMPMMFAIRMKETKKVIGFFGFKNGELKEGGTLEVFYSIHKDYWGQGFATEALRRMIDFGFKDIGLHRI